MSLILKSIEKSYIQGEQNIPVLKGIDFSIKSGEIVAILGQSGSGKSTLLSLISGLDRADKGQIEISGHSVADLSEEEWADFRSKNLGIIFQQYHLIPHLTAVENVALPMEILGLDHQEAIAKANGYLEEVGLSHRINHLPSQLSGGECQRVAIARSIANQPGLLLADEPSGNLDQQTGEQVMSYLFRVVKKVGTTLVLVTHNEDLARKCDRILRIEAGKLVSAL